MTYQLTSADSILRLADGAWIPPDPENTDYREYLAWLDEGNTPEPAPVHKLPAPAPDYRSFYDGLLTSIAYQNIRNQASTSLPLTVAIIEFSANLADAKAGAANVVAIQACIENIASAATNLSKADWAEIGGLLVENNLAELFSLPGAP